MGPHKGRQQFAGRGAISRLLPCLDKARDNRFTSTIHQVTVAVNGRCFNPSKGGYG
jgi:hypothetical protein